MGYRSLQTVSSVGGARVHSEQPRGEYGSGSAELDGGLRLRLKTLYLRFGACERMHGRDVLIVKPGFNGWYNCTCVARQGKF